MVEPYNRSNRLAMQFDKKETILKVSQNLFSRFGLIKTTVDEIARLARIGKGTVYHYFRSKEAIFAEIVEKESRILKEKILSAVITQNTPQEKLATFVKTRFRYLKEYVNYYSALTDDYLEHYAFIEEARRKHIEDEVRSVTKILDEGVSLGQFNIKDSGIAAQAIVFAMKGLEYPWTMEQDILDIDRSIDQLLNMLFKGIENR